MKVIREAVEVKDEGLEALMGQEVLVMCANYFYAGRLVGVNATCIKLAEPKIVYETGAFSSKGYADAQALPSPHWYVQVTLIESFGRGK